MRLETKTSIVKNDIALRMVLTYFVLFYARKSWQRRARPIGVESVKSVKSAHSCTIRIPRTIPANTPTEKIKSTSLICYVPSKLCASRVKDHEATGKARTDRMVSRKRRMISIVLGEKFYRLHRPQ